MNINLVPDLPEKQRSDLTETAAWLEKLIKHRAATDKKIAGRREIEAKALQRISKLNKEADEGSEDASLMLAAVRDQLARLRRTLELDERDRQYLLADMTDAADAARKEIRAAHDPIKQVLTDYIADFLTPFCRHRNEAVSVVQQSCAFGDLLHFTGPSYIAASKRNFDSVESADAALKSLLQTVRLMLDGKAVIALPAAGEAGGFSLPAFC